MSSGIVLEMENICGFSEAREDFLWSPRRKPQLLGAMQIETHSASRRVAEKDSKMFCNSKHPREISSGFRFPSFFFPSGSLPGHYKSLLGRLRSDVARSRCELVERGAPSSGDARDDAPIKHARHPAQLAGWDQESWRVLLTSLMIAAAVGSVRPPASVVGTPRASTSTR
jgi:hypothetical protein